MPRTMMKVERGDWGDELLRRVPDIERRIATSRPMPPDECGEDVPECFVPDLAFAEWLRGTFIDGSGPLTSPTLEHLADASIGVLWTNAIYLRQQRHILGLAEMPQTMGGAWKRGRAEQQLREWFDGLPDFLLTFYAPECARLDDRPFCGLAFHELLHCGQAKDVYDTPRFDKVGKPIFEMRGHDVEVFVEEVEYFGVTTPEVAALVRAAARRPLINDDVIARACGTCSARAA